jgi:Fuc2NAc and GlcNAc transferase
MDTLATTPDIKHPYSMSNTQLAALFLAFVALTLLLLKITHKYALKHLIDTPNERSSHTTPTPRGGGIAVAISSTALLLICSLSTPTINTELIFIALTCATLSILGYIDDHKPLSRRLRFGVTLAAFATSLAILPQPKLTFGNITLINPWILYPLLLISCTWILNLFNFMDGIDGIAAIKSITILIGASLILLGHSESQSAQLLLLLCAPALGFLYWNFPPAKIFLGDSGSYFWGGLLALLAIYTSTQTPLNLWCWAILLGTFITDSTWTLITRILTKQPWNSPHRSHAYQILSRRLNSHRTISLGTGIITLVWLAPWAYACSQHPFYAWIFCSIAYTPLAITCWRIKAGQKELKD